jgi:hypothetical protein
MAMKDASGYDAPASNAFAVTPADGSNLTHAARALFVGGAGNIKVDTLGGDTVTFTGVVAGSILPVRILKVYSTDTTATNIVAVY